MKIPLIYGLHSGQLYGTERMALATAEGLADEFESVIVAPSGPIHEECRLKGIETVEFRNAARFAVDIRKYIAHHKRLAVIGTRVLHSVICAGWNRIYGRRLANIHVVHGGVDERVSYGRKHRMNRLGVVQVAVSAFVRERLAAHGVDSKSVSVIENFLTRQSLRERRRRRPFQADGVRRIAVVSRLDPMKRVGLLLEAIEQYPELSDLEVEVFGTGWLADELEQRSARGCPNVRFLGFHENVASKLVDYDLLLHLCPEEPFGLVVLEAMAAGLPVLVPHTGGTGSIVTDGKNGFHFRANEARDLASRLIDFKTLPAESLNAVVAGGYCALESRFSPESRLEDYRTLLKEQA